MEKKVFVPLITHGREKYEFHTINPGVFLSEKSAIDAIIDVLVENEFISYEMYLDRNENKLG
jgi:hypothetical protein